MEQKIQISEIQIVPIKPQDGLIAFASFVLDKKYYIGSVAIYTRLNGEGFRLAYPTKKIGDKGINIFYPINSEVGNAIEKEVNKKVNEIYNIGVNENIGR
jgi:stage V sporulation protein G